MLNLVVTHVKHMKIKNQMKQYEGSRSVKPYLALNSLHKLPDGNRLTNFLYSPNGEKKKRAMVRECISKRRFATLKDAERVAGRFGQRVVKCRHCSGGFHCTSKKELKTTSDFLEARKQRRHQ
jgi:hypothetical protein